MLVISMGIIRGTISNFETINLIDKTLAMPVFVILGLKSLKIGR